MRQKAVVISTADSIAKIKVLRSSMCEGCASRGESGTCACGQIMGNNRVMITDATNTVGAVAGDDVEIETESTVVLGYAALVFVVPIAVFLLLYGIADSLLHNETIPWIIGACGFLFSFVPIVLIDRTKRKGKPQIHIVSVLRKHEHIHDHTNEDIQ